MRRAGATAAGTDHLGRRLVVGGEAGAAHSNSHPRLGAFPVTVAQEQLLTGPGRTLALGRRLGRLLRTGDFLALTGPLGAGKTQLIKGVAAGLGVPTEQPVVSPTFVLVREYVGRLKLYHIDAYRLTGAAELLALGVDEMLAEPGSVVAVEWADRVAEAVPACAAWIELEHAGRTQRRVRIRWAALAGRRPVA
ncbi:MAG: tRNA (adenosine(37)-N6)-threonylcarbamoyltransferase complex ATPase subunit type 1 TsaE [Phycisphaerae bacterium]|nr:tRNA (adenosine(37)-N6)-threonylcarbamoyltransferase complex ATPase subunit type 1 TsaE [Phycisphaerae bacterium]